MAGLHASASTSALQPPPVPTTPPLPPIRHSSTSQRTLRHAASFPDPPTTPPNKYRRPVGNAKGKEESTGNRQTDHSRREERGREQVSRQQQQQQQQQEADTRHSHGLSWSSTARDSLVDNLLTSLDELSQLAHRNYDDDEHNLDVDWSRFDTLNATTSDANTMTRTRGHTYSSSLSSDQPTATAGDSPKSTLSSPAHRSRRSASSSNFGVHHTFGSKSRALARFHGDDIISNQKTTASGNQPQTNDGSTHARGWSDASSADQQFVEALEAPLSLPPPPPPPKLGFAGGSRSQSADQIRPLSNGQESTSLSILNRGRPVPSVYSRYENAFDAAPEPTVYAGPRKMQNPKAIGPVYVNSAPPKQSALRKITTQSDLRAMNPTSSSAHPAIRDKLGNNMLDVAGDRTGSAAITQNRRDAQLPHPEKQGFFKRVFGGGKSTNDRSSDTANHAAVEHKPSTATSAVITPIAIPPSREESRQLSADHSATLSSQQAPLPPLPPPTLNKKPSSFFRRRKKSTSDVDKPPPVPVSATDRVQAAEVPQRGSVSSLRKVMGPFLADDPNKPGAFRQTDGSRPATRASVLSDELDIFHSGYTPPVVEMERSQSSKLLTDATLGSPQTKLKVKNRREDMPPATAVSQSSIGSPALDATSRAQSNLAYIHTNASTSQIEPAKVSPLLDVDHSLDRDDRRVSALTPAELDTPASEEMRDFAAGNNVNLSMDSDTWLVAHGKDTNDTQQHRLVLQPSEEHLADIARAQSLPTPPSTTDAEPTMSLNAISSPTDQALSPHLTSSPADAINHPQLSPEFIDANADYQDRARRIFEGNETDVSKMEAASWLGESKTLNTRTLHEYMHLYDFSQMNILTALRTLCGKLVLRGETQQFDRIITALSGRWCECNPTHGFKAQDVVHTICYSLILLNTDLHLADIGEKMSRSAYVKNTLPTIKRVVVDAAPNAFDDNAKNARSGLPWSDGSMPSSPALPPDTPLERTSFESARPTGISKRNSIRPGASRTDSDMNSSNALVNAPWTGPSRGWDNEVETVLKSFFTSIKNEPLPLLTLSVADRTTSDRNLSVNNLGLKRTGSVVSKAPSDTISSRSRGIGLRNLALGWQGRNNRSRQKIFSTNTMSSSRTSFDDNSSVWSPAQSSTWSKNSMGKTLTSTSMNSLAASYMTTDREFKHSIGFANALSHVIIREEGGGIIGADSDSFTIKGDLLEDESLTLEGAPWAKEGMVKHKHHLEAPDRKSKERSWNECFAVISRGKLTLFNFNTEVKTRSLGRPRTKQGQQTPSLAGSRVGGGDWMENAEQLGVFVLRHTISSTLPPPGYSKARPFVWALSLPSGAVHLFQVGTPEIAEEWMTTANYWSARLSKEPLSGGVSNIEYGWSDAVVNSAILEKSESFSSPPRTSANRQQPHIRASSSGTGARQSMQSSVRGSFDFGGSSKQRLPGDKAHITEWSPPGQSIMASTLPEADQLRSLTSYVTSVEAELETHHELKPAIELAYSPRHSNYNKAMNNWQRKSEYLLREVVKFRTYMDSLAASQKSKDEVYTKRAEKAQLMQKLTPASGTAGNANANGRLSPSNAGRGLRRTSSNLSASTVSLHVSDI